ncbi:MAG: hypothetical protein L3K08_04210 [Thermoplasmata archaeon]|nr:hypothetical protein [Thermoplasmata archaeon]
MVSSEAKGPMQLAPDGTNRAYFYRVPAASIDRASFTYRVDPALDLPNGTRVDVPAGLAAALWAQDNGSPGSPNAPLGIDSCRSFGVYHASEHQVEVVLVPASPAIPTSWLKDGATEFTVECPEMPYQVGHPDGCRLDYQP